MADVYLQTSSSYDFNITALKACLAERWDTKTVFVTDGMSDTGGDSDVMPVSENGQSVSDGVF